MINPVKELVRLKKERDERPKELALSFGEQDPMDIISYAGMEEQHDYLRVDGQFVRCLHISGYPKDANTGFLDRLINFQHNADISYHMKPVPASTALKVLHRKVTERESTRRAYIRDGKIVGPEITEPLEDAQDFIKEIQRGEEKLFLLSIYVSLTADSLAELDKITKHLETDLSADMFFIKIARYQQVEAMQSILPRGENILNQNRNIKTSALALTFPLTSSELVQESGILYGVNQSNDTLVILDRFSLNNANSIVFAQSGSGKSYATKVEILRQLMQGTKVIVIDPEREYENLAKSVSGTYIKLSATSKQKINPFDTATTAHTKEQLAEHAQDLIEVIARMVASPDKKDKSPALTAEERAEVDDIILKLYKKAGDKTPTLRQFCKAVQAAKLLSLSKKLDKYLDGTLAGIFDKPTNIDLDERLVVFDIKDLQESVRQPMMMVISNFVKNRVMAKPEKRLLVIDEGWILMQDEESARFVTSLVRRARKYYLGVSIITQQAEDFLKDEYGRTIASQSALRILMRQDSTTIEQVVSQFGLSEQEEQFLLTCGRGEALIIADQNHVAVEILASEKEHPLITTDPSEVYDS